MLQIEELKVEVDDKEILKNVNMESRTRSNRVLSTGYHYEFYCQL